MVSEFRVKKSNPKNTDKMLLSVWYVTNKYMYVSECRAITKQVIGADRPEKPSGPSSDATERDVWSGSTLFATQPALF